MSQGPGLVVLFGSGETSPSGRKVFEWLLGRLTSPIRAAVLETPAGFELNSAQVAGRIAEFLSRRLQNYRPQVTVVPARKRNTPFSPDDPGIVAPLLDANLIFLGPGSPTYAVRQLQDSLAWHTLIARHRLGAAIALASAAAIAASAHALPVYEIYKAGDELHWRAGLNFFAPYGLPLVFIPHWNNAEGGPELDTSRCFMGQARFEQLLALLPPRMTIVGIDEHTALVMDLSASTCRVIGRGGVTWLREGQASYVGQGHELAIAELGPFHKAEPSIGLPPEVWEGARAGQAQTPTHTPATPEPSHEVLALAADREAARSRRDWSLADALRGQIADLGWQVSDTPQGPKLELKH